MGGKCTSVLLQAGLLAGVALLILAVFRFGGADRAFTSLFYDASTSSFPLRDTWLLAVVGHTVLKWSMLGIWALCLALGGALRRGALYMAGIVLAVLALKHYSPVSCPWDLIEYGGKEPQAGRCLPAAHPLTGFSLFGLYLALRQQQRRAAGGVLAAAWIIGLAAGAIQVARGAHFASHVLWTAWVAWALTLLLSRLPLLAAGERRRA
jgi:membrane-associated PAP2 superfamily phosphatase